MCLSFQAVIKQKKTAQKCLVGEAGEVALDKF